MAGPDDESLSLVTNWIVESKSFREEYQDYSHAISVFDNISKDGKHVILFEIKKKRSDGTIVKKTPLLNSKKTKLTPSKQVGRNTRGKSDNLQKDKGKFKSLKIRIIILAIVLFVFIIMIYIFNSITSGPSNLGSVHHFILSQLIPQSTWYPTVH